MHKNYEKEFQRHSKTFSFASRFFGKKQARKIAKLYYFFRYVDDIADGENHTHEEKKSLINESVYLEELKDIQKHFHLPNEIIQSFIEASILDIKFEKMKTNTDLLRYCYGVASTVGLSMCHLLGVHEKNAFHHAIDLGVAMQLTNICRDVYEDYQSNRIYLPELSKEDFKNHEQEKIHQIQLNYLALADNYYESGIKGLTYLPLRARLVIYIAAKLYQKIGTVIKKNKNFKKRAYVSGVRKVALVFLCIPKLITINFLKKNPKHNKDLHINLIKMPYANV